MQQKTKRVSQLRWQQLWRRLGGQSDPAPIYQILWHAYHEPQRAYHAWGHIQDCLREFDAACAAPTQIEIRHPAEIEMAIWFHDVVYDTGFHETQVTDNEGRSADMASDLLERGGVPADVLDRIVALILVTRHREPPVYPDARVMVDVDLAPLGFAPDIFQRYSRYIRREYQHVPEDVYCRERARILTSFLNRPVLYTTHFFRSRYETQARRNLAQSIAQLSHQTGAFMTHHRQIEPSLVSTM